MILDEVQRVPDWSIEVRALFDDERARKNPIKIVLLGSASWLLTQGLNETLAGRFEYIRASHWSLAESISSFKKQFPKSKTIILDLNSGTQFLSSQSPKDFILHLI